MKLKRTRDLKAWSDPAWQRKLSKTLTVSRVDESIPGVKLRGARKPWFIALTQKPELLNTVGGVRHLPDGKTMLLSEDDVLALVRYLVEPQTALWSDNPEPTEPGKMEAVTFMEPGLVALTQDGQLFNGETMWSPEYFEQRKPYDAKKHGLALKVHTLPWKREPSVLKRRASKATIPKRKR